MITLLVASLAISQASQIGERVGSVNIEKAINLARRLGDRNQSLDGVTDGYEWLLDGQHRVEDEPQFGTVNVLVGGGLLSFYKATGALRTVQLSDSQYEKFRKVKPESETSDEALVQAAAEIFALVGYTSGSPIGDIQRTRSGPNGTCRLIAQPTVGIRPLGMRFRAWMDLDLSRGQLVMLYLPRPPKLDHANDVVLESAQLEKMAREAYLADTPYEDGVVFWQGLELDVPNFKMSKELTQDYWDLAVDNQVIPVYQVGYGKRAEVERNAIRAIQSLVLDARNGRVLQIVKFDRNDWPGPASY